jgi:alpha-D-ribose 1-methylphosphonate 5-phosphate C-P lyase
MNPWDRRRAALDHGLQDALHGYDPPACHFCGSETNLTPDTAGTIHMCIDTDGCDQRIRAQHLDDPVLLPM